MNRPAINDRSLLNPARIQRMVLAVWFTSMVALAIAVASGFLAVPQAPAGCGIRSLTGFPCPLCGGTRALKAASRLDHLAALRLNPLVCLAAWGAVIVAGGWLIGRITGLSFPQRAGAAMRRLPVRPLVWTLIGLNWLYLCLVSPF